MHWIDYVLFGVYMCLVLGIGVYYFFRNKSVEDYYVGNRGIKPWHVGMSVVATDVGGGFSIGLGGLGYVIGLSGSWMLFTGLLGAWLVAVFVIPIIKRVDAKHAMLTYPDFLRYRFGGKVALLAALISGIGYMGFTGAQALAGATLAEGTIFRHYDTIMGLPTLEFALYVIAAITIFYTVLGGLKAVIYTDTIQWIILLSGLILLAIPFALHDVGGFAGIREALPAEFLSLSNFEKALDPVNWLITILPIWLIGMTLYQRMYAVKGEKEAKQAWFIAGLFEWPIMAFTGVFLGMLGRIEFPGVSPEQGLPMLIADVLPLGIAGIVVASYFSAIMSTADSCLMASSGNFVNDVIQRFFAKGLSEKGNIRLSMVATFVIGVLAIVLALQFNQVLEAMLYAYGFMVGGLFVPTFGAYFWKKASPTGALWGMLAGGVVTATLQVMTKAMPDAGLIQFIQGIGLDPVAYGIVISAAVFIVVSLLVPGKPGQAGEYVEETPAPAS
jgi:SSS family solute:Na+ symporter